AVRDGRVRHYAGQEIGAKRNDGRFLAGFELLGEQADAAFALIGPALIVADGAHAGEQVHIPHHFRIDDRRNVIYLDLLALAVEAHLVGADEQVDARVWIGRAIRIG